MPAWTALIGAGLRTTLSRRIAALSDTDRAARSALPAQHAQLALLVDAAQRTQFGLAHDFPRLARFRGDALVRAFRSAVPVADYEAFRPLLARMRDHAEPGVTWPGVVRDWAQTSGTTAGDKFIPVSKRMLRSNARAAFDVFAHAARAGVSLPRVFAGRALFLGGSSDLTTNAAGCRTGDLSGVVTPLIRWPISRVYLPSKDVALMADWPAKIDAMARQCLRADVRLLSGMPSWSLVLFDRMLELAREQGLPARSMRDLWPNLVLFVHGGVKYSPFEARVRERWSGAVGGPDVPRRLEVYPASEGFIAIQDTPGDPGLRLNTDIGLFFEFVPLEEINAPSPRAFTCAQVEKGQRYVVVMSTCAGLWRYNIGDVVEFDTVPPGGPPRLRIVGRHRHFINAFGENIIVEHVENAVVAAARHTHAAVGEFTAAPVYPATGRRAGLELAVEWPSPAPPDARTLAAFADAFDRALKSQNVDYTTKRTADLGMAPPVITPLPPGAFHRWMDSRGKLGGQHKAPRCANPRDLIDSIRQSAGIASQPVLGAHPLAPETTAHSAAR